MPNINIDTVQECNLLCKCIIDYIENKSVNYQKSDSKLDFTDSKGNYINYSDTNYEVQEVKFYGPSDFTIDGERFDMEVIIKHTNPSHIHYFLEDVNSDKQNKHFHYHERGENPPLHTSPPNNLSPNHYNEVYLHILYNIGDHKNTRINNFFSQFIHRNGTINNLKNWSLDQLIPKTRSFFMYEKNNTVRIIFDSIETIDKGIYDLLSPFPPPTQSPDPTNGLILYKKNIEIITDEKYKSDIRQQIKELVGMRVALTQQSKPGLAQDYMKKAGEILYEAKYGGDFDSYQDNESTAIKLTKAWKDYGKGDFESVKTTDLGTDYDTYDEEKMEEIEFDLNKSDSGKILGELDLLFKNYLKNNHIDLFPDYKGEKETYDDKTADEKKKDTEPDLNETERKEFEVIKEFALKYNILVKGINYHTLTKNYSDYDTDDDGDLKDFSLIFKRRESGPSSVESILKSLRKINGNGELSIYLFNSEGNLNASITKESHNMTEASPIDISAGPIKDILKKQGLFFLPADAASNYCVEYVIKNLSINDVGNNNNNIIISNEAIPTDLQAYSFMYHLFGGEKVLKEFGEDNIPFDEQTYFIEEGQYNMGTDTADGNTDPNKIILGNTKMEVFKTVRGINNGKSGVNVRYKPNENIIKYNLIKYILYNIDPEPTDPTNPNYKIYQSKKQIQDSIFFLKRGEEMYRTRGGYECQNWHSNEVHYEGIWNIFKSPHIFPKGGKIWGELTMNDRKLIQDGLLIAKKSITENESFNENTASDSEVMNNLNEADIAKAEEKNEKRRDLILEDKISEAKKEDRTSNIKWFSHNKCRNPGNKKSAPWCYTKNPKKRWDYCTEPDYSGKIARVVLMIVFLFCILLAFLMVKVLFRHEYFTAFIARLTGAQVGSEAGGAGAK